MAARALLIAANVSYAIVLLTLGLMSRLPGFVPSISDLLAHSVAYAIQTVLLFTLFLPSFGLLRASALAATVAVLYGGLVEGLQCLQPARSVEIGDVLANTTGAVSATLLLYLVGRTSAGGTRR